MSERETEAGLRAPLTVDFLVALGDIAGAKSLMEMEDGRMAPVRPQRPLGQSLRRRVPPR